MTGSTQAERRSNAPRRSKCACRCPSEGDSARGRRRAGGEGRRVPGRRDRDRSAQLSKSSTLARRGIAAKTSRSSSSTGRPRRSIIEARCNGRVIRGQRIRCRRDASVFRGRSRSTPPVFMRLYNTLSRREEDFAPVERQHVRMYTCGLTVYARGHIGNFRTFVALDVLRRALKCRGGLRRAAGA